MGAGASGFGGRDPWGVRDEPEEFEGFDNQAIAQQQKTIIQGSVLYQKGTCNATQFLIYWRSI